MASIQKPQGKHALKHFGKSLHENSISINEQYRICFMWGKTGPYNVEVTNYH